MEECKWFLPLPLKLFPPGGSFLFSKFCIFVCFWKQPELAVDTTSFSIFCHSWGWRKRGGGHPRRDAANVAESHASCAPFFTGVQPDLSRCYRRKQMTTIAVCVTDEFVFLVLELDGVFGLSLSLGTTHTFWVLAWCWEHLLVWKCFLWVWCKKAQLAITNCQLFTCPLSWNKPRFDWGLTVGFRAFGSGLCSWLLPEQWLQTLWRTIQLSSQQQAAFEHASLLLWTTNTEFLLTFPVVSFLLPSCKSDDRRKTTGYLATKANSFAAAVLVQWGWHIRDGWFACVVAGVYHCWLGMSVGLGANLRQTGWGWITVCSNDAILHRACVGGWRKEQVNVTIRSDEWQCGQDTVVIRYKEHTYHLRVAFVFIS